MTNRLTIAAVQANPKLGAIEQNEKAALAWIAAARSAGAGGSTGSG